MKCWYCGKRVRDKWLFGTMHVCMTDSQRRQVDQRHAIAMNQKAVQLMLRTQPYENPFLAPLRPLWRDMPDLG